MKDEDRKIARVKHNIDHDKKWIADLNATVRQYKTKIPRANRELEEANEDATHFLDSLSDRDDRVKKDDARMKKNLDSPLFNKIKERKQDKQVDVELLGDAVNQMQDGSERMDIVLDEVKTMSSAAGQQLTSLQ